MVRDLLDAKNLSQLIGGMGVGHGEHIFFSFRTVFASLGSKADEGCFGSSSLPYGGIFGSLRVPTLLCQLALWYRFRSR